LLPYQPSYIATSLQFVFELVGQLFSRELQEQQTSLVPKASTPPVFDCLQYAKMEGEGLGNFIMWSAARPSNVVMSPLNSQVICETDLAFCASYKDGTSASTEHMKHTPATRHDSKRLLSDKREST